MKQFCILSLLFIVFACNSSKEELKPTLSLNEVLACKDLAGLDAQYGKANVRRDTSWVMGDDTLQGTILFPASPKQVFIYFRGKQIVDVTIAGTSSAWKTASGLYLGLPLKDVQKVNQKNFTLSGFNWAHGGAVVSWEGGKLVGDSTLSHLATFSNPTNTHVGVSDSDYEQISGQAEFDVRHAAIQQLNPLLDQISLIKPFVPGKEEGIQLGNRVQRSQNPPR